MVELCRAVGRKRALHMLLTGQPISAQTALDWGLVNDVVPVSELKAGDANTSLSNRRRQPADCLYGQAGLLRPD